MNPLQELATQALLGTERRPPVLAALDGALGELLEAVSPADGALEINMLRRAGILAACADAGFMPALFSVDTPQASASEPYPAVTDPKWISALGEIFQDGPDRLREEALCKLAENGATLPPRLLPAALALAHKTPVLQPALLEVLGQRGRWLAQWQPDWAYALQTSDGEPDLALWEQGTLEARKAFLKRLRGRDPVLARALFDKALVELDARERLTLLEPFAVGLDPADEDFLEQRLTDRGKEVRLLAANLLARLPGSRYVGRMTARLAACLTHERKLLRQVWNIEPPAAFEADWKADAIEESRVKSEPLGERAWWLYQIARAVPLAWWSAHTRLSPADLVKWAKKTDWSEAIFRAWNEALARGGQPAWAEAFLAERKLPGLAVDLFEWLTQLPAAQRESHWLDLLKKTRRGGIGEWLSRIVQDGAPCSADFSRQVLQNAAIEAASDNARWDYSLRKALPDFICQIPVELLDEAGRNWPIDQPRAQYFSETVARVIAIAELRKTLHRPPSPRNPS
ncbi:MAG: hypothetical protein IPK09_12930 [Candidatus Competibacteraceae bacterium]|nr:hypothetical protein [Candidatus Competibacteraceae bacterium]